MSRRAATFDGLVKAPMLPRSVLSRQGSGARSAGLVIAALLGALLFGLVAVMGNPVFVALAAGLVLGPLLLFSPLGTVWAFMAGSLLLAGVVQLFAGSVGSRMAWALSGLGFLLFALALVRAVVDPRTRRHTPAFIWLLLVFVGYTVVNAALQGSSVYEFASGFKRYHQAVGLTLALTWLGFSGLQFAQWRRLFVLAVVVQTPLALYQLWHFVPIREALRWANPGLVPVDVVAGTFGSGLLGGGANSGMAAFLVVMLGFAIAYRREGLISRGRFVLLLAFLLTPLALGETKIVVVLLPVVFLTLFWRRLLTRPLFGLIGLSLGILMTLSAATIYVQMSNKSLDDRIADTIAYNFGDRGYGRAVLNRTTVLTFWANEQSLADPVGAVMGHGLGTAHDVTGGSVARRFSGYGIGLTTASLLLWEQGVFGLMLFLVAWALAVRAAIRLLRSATDPDERATLTGIVAALWIIGIYFVYHDLPVESLPYQTFSASILGYLAWLHRQRALASAR